MNTETRENTLLNDLKKVAIAENTATLTTKTSELTEETLDKLREYHCLDEKGQLLFNIVEANGCVFLVDPLKPNLAPEENAVYPHHDEAAQLLMTAKGLDETFDTVIDAFRGGEHATIPILNAEIADKAKSIDINPRSTILSKANAAINGLDEKIEPTIGDTTQEIPQKEGKTLFVANPPFALAVKGVNLAIMRDGGENGLTLTNAYLRKAIEAADSEDVIIGVAYSRIKKNSEIELENEIKRLLTDDHEYSIEIIEGENLWRGPNGKKEQPNPMPLSDLYKKAQPECQESIDAYNRASSMHLSQGWEKLGYFRYVIRMKKVQGIMDETKKKLLL